MEWIIAFVVQYFTANFVYTIAVWETEGGLSLKQTSLCFFADILVLFSMFFLIWFIPMIFSDRFRVGGDLREKP